MENKIKAIETEYNGYRFRSRLEARWAVFFDAAGIEYQYEAEGFDGGDGKRYLPDFYFPEHEIFAEVKGTDKMLFNSQDKISSVIINNSTPVSNGLIILGDIPMVVGEDGDTPMFSFIRCVNGNVNLCHATFWCENGETVILSDLREIKKYVLGIRLINDSYNNVSHGLPEYTSVHPRTIREISGYKPMERKLLDAYKIARQSRFEFGDTPTFK